jgi:hypothetical protein
MSNLDIDNLDLLKQFSSSLVKKKVDIVEFAESDEYCNRPLYPHQRLLLKLIFLEELTGEEEDMLDEWINSTRDGGDISISPKIRDRVAYLREIGYPHFGIIQMILGRRSGKGFMTAICIAKKIYDLIQIEDPSAYFGIAKGENIYVTIIADSQDQAKKYQFKDARNTILDNRALQEYLGQPLAESLSVYTPADLMKVRNLRDKRVNADKALASLRVEAFAKNSRTIRGNASIVVSFDEMAHITPGESHISDEELYKAVEPAMITFKEQAMLFANSSPYTKTGKFYEIYTQAMELEPPIIGEPTYPNLLMLKAPSWEMYRNWEKSPHSTILTTQALVVSPDWDPEIPGVLEMKAKERKDPDAFRVEYRSHFADVEDSFLNPFKVEEMYDQVRNLSVLDKKLENREMGTIEHVYKAHGDPSSTGANFGFAIAHVEMIEEKHPITEDVIQAPHVVFDLIDAFYPDDFENDTIDWLEIMPVFIEYINHFRPYEFTFDQFDSSAPIQMLQAEAQRMGAWGTNIFVKTATPGVNRQRALNFKAALNLGRVHAPSPPTSYTGRNSLALSMNELKFLVEKHGRIEKQDFGPVQTKDIADCIMECVDALIGESLMADMALLGQHMVTGAPGGYPLNSDPSLSGPFDAWYNQRHTTDIAPQLPSHQAARGIRRQFGPRRNTSRRGYF